MEFTLERYEITSKIKKEIDFEKARCDKYDYAMAVFCGSIAAIVDIFLVGAPGEGKLGEFSDAAVDKAVKKFAKLTGWKPNAGNENNISNAIGFLEDKFKVNYDHRYTSDVQGKFEMGTKNHHLKSLGHSPDIIGLFFSILDQFTSSATFISDGQIIRVDTETFKLKGSNFITKLFCGFANWLGHLMSDVAGSYSSRGSGTGRGSGIPIPFYNIFQFFNFGKFNTDQGKQDFATLMTRVFQEGYDFRHGLAMSVPVLMIELSIRALWP